MARQTVKVTKAVEDRNARYGGGWSKLVAPRLVGPRMKSRTAAMDLGAIGDDYRQVRRSTSTHGSRLKELLVPW